MSSVAALSCAALWAVSSVLQKEALRDGEISARDLQLVISGVFFAGSAAWKLLADGGLSISVGPRTMSLAVASGLAGFVLAYAALLWALTHTSVTRAIALAYTTPLFVLVIAGLLGEHLTWRSALGATLVVTGGLLVV